MVRKLSKRCYDRLANKSWNICLFIARVVRELKAKGTKIDLQNGFGISLFKASQNGHIEVVRLC